ncbi:MAG: hypothetical protein AVDCRST_MAG73-3381, partial [uncultured Thermomicrobiales bacterium]
ARRRRPGSDRQRPRPPPAGPAGGGGALPGPGLRGHDRAV